MSRKRSLRPDELESVVNMSENEWDEFLRDNSDDDQNYEPSSESDSSEGSTQLGPIRPTTSDETEEGDMEENLHIQDPDIDNASEWSSLEENPPIFQFDVPNVGLQTQDLVTIEYLVNLFFTNEFIGLLVEQTNLYAAQEIQKNPLTRSSRLTRWVDTNNSEMRVFLGLLLHMGPCSFPSIEHYWNKDVMYEMRFWKSVMGRNRFQLLLRFWHFADNSLPSENRLRKINPVLSHLNEVMRKNYIPDKSLCIDESLVAWRGRLFFRQYIKNKKHKYGVKFYELCESNGLVLRIKIYCGKSEPVDRAVGHAAEVVLHLMDEFLDKGYVLYTDNFYNSVSLTNLLSSRKTYICGTLRGNRKGNPKNIIDRKLKKGDCVWSRKDSVVVCKWKDKRDVLTISNMHKVEMVEVRNRNGKVAKKPNIIRDYNNGMSGIDRADQMLSYYTALRKTIRWPKKIGLHIMEIYLQNAYILFRKSTGSNIKSLKFRESFIACLIGDKMPNKQKINKEEPFHYLENIPPTEKKQRPTKPCRVCTSQKKRRETRYQCPVCEEKPALCVDTCFKEYHQ